MSAKKTIGHEHDPLAYPGFCGPNVIYVTPEVEALLLAAGLVERRPLAIQWDSTRGRPMVSGLHTDTSVKDGERWEDVTFAAREAERILSEARESKLRKRLLQSAEVII